MVAYPCPVEGVAFVRFAPDKEVFYQTYGGKEFRRASVNHRVLRPDAANEMFTKRARRASSTMAMAGLVTAS